MHREFIEHLADYVALETQRPSNAANKSSVRAVEPADGDGSLWEAVRDGDGPKQHNSRHRRKPGRW